MTGSDSEPTSQPELKLAGRLGTLVASSDLTLDEARAGLAEAKAALFAQAGRQNVLTALYQTATEIIDVHVVGQVLQDAVSRAKALLKSDLGYLALYDAESRGTRVTATVGSVSPDFGSLHVPLGIGMGGRVSQMRVPFVTPDYLVDERLVHLPRIDEGIQSEGVRGMVGVPLIARHQFLGALFVADRTVRRYTDEEVNCLQGLAALIAVALENARLFEREDAALKRTQLAYQSLNTRLVATEREASLHRRMVAVVGRNGSLEELASIVEKELGAVARFAPTVEALSVGDEERESFYRAQVGGKGLWTLEVEASAPLTGTDRRVLERIVHAAETLISRKDLREIEKAWAGGMALQRLLDDGLTATEAIAVQQETGVDLFQPCEIVAFKSAKLSPEKTISLLRPILSSSSYLIGQYGKMAVAIVPADQKFGLPKLRDSVSKLVGEPIAIATASCPEPFSQAEQFVRKAMQSAEMIIAFGQAGSLDDVNIPPEALLLRNAEPKDVEACINALLGTLIEDSARNSGNLLPTLRVYFDVGLNATKAAEQLGVHYKTVNQRLGKISRISNLDFKDPKQMLRMQIALLLLGMRECGEHIKS